MLPEHTWVRDLAALERLAAAVRAAAWVAIDSESNSMFCYRERVCLIQLHVPDERRIYLIDPLAFPTRSDLLAPLAEPLADPSRRVWIHGGEYDVACLVRDFGLRLAGLFDTQQAASFLGWPKTGYGSLVERLCGKQLGKQHAQYDWGRRPLDTDALRYAIDDVLHLPEVGHALEQQIIAADLAEELALANAVVAATPAQSTSFDPGRIWRLEGVRELSPERMGVLAALHGFRDRLGQALDLPPGRVIANALLVVLARKAPTTLHELSKLRLRRSLLDEHGDALLAVIAEALEHPPELPPQPGSRRPAPAQRRRDERLRSWRRRQAEQRGVPVHVVLPPRALGWLAEHGAEQLEQCPELGAKRIARYGAELRELCRD